MRDLADLIAALRTLDEACGEDDRQFRWRVRQLRDTPQPQRKASDYPYGVRLNVCAYTDANEPGRLCRLVRGHEGPHCEWSVSL
jgi:hypothetical protein